MKFTIPRSANSPEVHIHIPARTILDCRWFAALLFLRAVGGRKWR